MKIAKTGEDLSARKQAQLYLLGYHPLLDTGALFADGSAFYRQFSLEGDKREVRLRLRTLRDNAEQVTLVCGGKRREMEWAFREGLFDYYETWLHVPEECCRYYYEVRSGKVLVYYTVKGADLKLDESYAFRLNPDLQTPDWAKGAVFYQIFVDRFCNGDPSNDVVDGEYFYISQRAWTEKIWSAPPVEPDVCHFYGGDLQGVLDKLDYLQDLGVQVIYLNPIFVSPSDHKYDTQDYDHVDPHFARIVRDEGEVLDWNDHDNRHASRYINRVTSKENLDEANRFFADFTKEVHRRGMRVILDGVFNHCGSFNKWIDMEHIYEGRPGYAPGAGVSADSPYRDFFSFRSDSWPDNRSYEGWWDHATLPKLNYEASQKLQDYILEVGARWVCPPYNADGWRLDVAADLGHSPAFNHAFWKKFRKAVKAANPDALILAENYSDPSDWLKGDEWDTIMNYQAFMEPVSWFLTGMEKHSDFRRDDLCNNYEAFRGSMARNMANLPYEALLTSMNELSNHDHSRFLTRTGGKTGRLAAAGTLAAQVGIRPEVMREAVIIQMTWPGAPTVYYGDEAGVCGWTDPDNRRTYPWGREDRQMLDFHKEAIRIHRQAPVLHTGSLKLLYGETGVLCYARFDRRDCYLTILNNTDEEKKLSIPVWQAAAADDARMERLLLSRRDGFTTEREQIRLQAGTMQVSMGARSAAVFREMSSRDR